MTDINEPNALMSNAIERHDELGIGNQFGIRGFYSRPYRSKFVGPNIRNFPRFAWPILLILKNLRAFFFASPNHLELFRRRNSNRISTFIHG